MKTITILCENLVGKLIRSGEHGFSAFIEKGRGNYLFDTGIGVSHCTGMRTVFRLHLEFWDRFFYGCVGSVWEV
ncbi:MAG: hypothetical protein A2156_03165 [Deltaproteobacteria bacterium RBG_16_48_10]|nr:MAG: hypothetical protein A2156_03165 [Deltaproteobacteria bacterium RBG_16_48_10]